MRAKGGAAAGQALQSAAKADIPSRAVTGAVAATAAGQEEDTSNYRKIQTSDGARHLIHPEDLEEARKRDPNLKVLDQPGQWVKVKMGDGSVLEVHPADLAELQKRNPDAQIQEDE